MLIFKKEKAVVDLVIQHIDKTAECVAETIASLRSYITEDDSGLNSAVHQVNSLEAEADELLREIRDLLYSGAYLPSIRGDIYRLMSAIDDISNKSESCFDCFHCESPKIPAEFVAEFEVILDLTSKCFGAFNKALKAYFSSKDKLEKVARHGKRVGELESRIDDIERAMTMRIFSSSMDMGEKLHLRRCIKKLTKISDATEDATDQLQWVSVKSIV